MKGSSGGNNRSFRDKAASFRSSFLFALLLNAVILCFYMALFRPNYDTNDDLAMMEIVCGAHGAYDCHLIFSNSLLGRVLVLLYRAAGHVPWYPLMQYAVMLLSFSVITYVLIRKNSHPSFVFLWTAALLLFAHDFYVAMQFTKTASIAAAAGSLLIIDGADAGRNEKKQNNFDKVSAGKIICGILLAETGFLYRFHQAACVILVCSALGVWVLLTQKETDKKETKKRLFSCVLAFAVLGALALGLQKADGYSYSSPEWREYRAYDTARSRLLDYGVPDYDENQELYDSLAIDRAGHDLLLNWIHIDDNRFTVSSMNALSDSRPERKADYHLIFRYIISLVKGFAHLPSCWGFLILFLFWLCAGKHPLKEYLSVLFLLAVLGGIYLYFFNIGRYLIPRVDIGIWAAASAVFLLVASSDRAWAPKGLGIILLALVLLGSQYRLRYEWRSNQVQAESDAAKVRAQIEKINADQEHLYLTKVRMFAFEVGYPLWREVPFGTTDNMYPLGGWGAKMPVKMKVLEKYGVRNPLEEAAGSDRIYIADDDIELLLTYIRNWYCPDAQAEQVDQIGDVPVWRIVTGE